MMRRKRFEFSGGVWREKRKPRFRFFSKLLLLAGVSAIAWSYARPQPSTPITIITAQRKDMNLYVASIGSVQPAKTVIVRPQVAGQITEILFKEGQGVKKGDVLARLDASLYNAQLAQAMANKEQDEAQLQSVKQQLKQLGKSNASRKISLANTIAQFEAAIKSDSATIAQSQALLNYTTIRATIDGRAGLKRVDVGNIVQPTDKEGLVEITQMDPVSVVFSVPEQNLSAISASLSQNLPLHVTALDNQTGSKLEEGMVELADNQVSAQNGALRMKAHFANTSRKLWPGAIIPVQLSLGTMKAATVVPVSALIQRGNDHFVYKIDAQNKSVAVQPVALMARQGNEAAVSGIKPGDQLAMQSLTPQALGTMTTAR